ncbi:Beta-1,3-galactosyltransferase 5, partial [Pseudolycoriella hygida]
MLLPGATFIFFRLFRFSPAPPNRMLVSICMTAPETLELTRSHSSLELASSFFEEFTFGKRSMTLSGLKGYMPHFSNPDTRFAELLPYSFSHNFLRSFGKASLMTFIALTFTLPNLKLSPDPVRLAPSPQQDETYNFTTKETTKMIYLSGNKMVKRGLILLLCSAITFFIFTAIPPILQLPLKLNLSPEPLELPSTPQQDQTYELTTLQPKLSPQRVPPSLQQDQTYKLTTLQPKLSPQRVPPSLQQDQTYKLTTLQPKLSPQRVPPSLQQDQTYKLTTLQPKLLPQRVPPSPQQDQTYNFSSLQPKQSPQRQRTHIILNNEDFCRRVHSDDSNKTAVIWVISARQHFMQRHLIRQTWGAVKSYNNVTILGVIFMLGSSDGNGEQITDAAQINEEADSETFKTWNVDYILSFTIIAVLPSLIQSVETDTMLESLSPQRPNTHIIFNNKDLCSNNAPIVRIVKNRNVTKPNNKTAIIWVSSAREHFLQRNLIRQTYGAVKSYNNVTILGVVFMLGSSDRNGEQITDVAKLNAETVEFGDIIIGDFITFFIFTAIPTTLQLPLKLNLSLEPSENLSRKAIMAVEWITTYCPEAQLVIKTDDDVVLNIFRLTEELNALSPIDSTSPNFRCRLDVNEKTITNLGSQFYVAPGTFKNDIFPDHCQGLGWVAPMNVIVRIAEEIKRSFVGWVLTHEDVFITSIVPAKVNEKSSENERIQYIDKARNLSKFFFFKICVHFSNGMQLRGGNPQRNKQGSKSPNFLLIIVAYV